MSRPSEKAMGMSDGPSWTERHIAAFRNHRGHQACTVEGCIGSQPLVWVPTAHEVWAESQSRGTAVDWQPDRSVGAWIGRSG